MQVVETYDELITYPKLGIPKSAFKN